MKTSYLKKITVVLLLGLLSITINSQTVTIPNANFEQVLIDLGIDTNGLTGDILRVDAENAITLDVSDKNISDLTGIEAFVNLEVLLCARNTLTSINVSQNINLVTLECGQNQLVSIDVSSNIVLDRLKCDRNLLTTILFPNNSVLDYLSTWNNQISSIDLSELFLLKTLFIFGNQLNNLNITQNTILELLSAGKNNLSNVDITNNLLLKFLFLDDNQIENINVENHSLLERLQIHNNKIPTINVTNNTELTILFLENNQLTNVDVSQNTKLKNLAVGINPITELDVTNNVNLWALTTEVTQISSLDVSKNIILEQMWIADNPNLTQLDLFNNPLLFNLGIYNTSIETLDLSNNSITRLAAFDNPNLIHLDIRNGNNVNVTTFNIGNTPNLTCINADASISQSMTDSGKMFSEDCGDFVYIPDANFEQALIDLGIDSDGVVNTTILRSDAESVTGQLNVSNKNISDLTGIEGFTNLTRLKAWDNLLTDVDVTQNINLTRLELVNNQITDIDVSQNTELTVLWLENNLLTSVNVSQNTKLQNLAVGINPLTALDVSTNINLWALTTEDTQISSLDVSKNIILEQMWIRDNPNLTELDLSKNPLLWNLGIYRTAIETLDLSNNPIRRLWAFENPILAHLDLRNSNNINLTDIRIENTPSLTCINADATISQAMTDSGKMFSEDCGDFVYIPDANFEQTLIDLGIDNDGVVNTAILRSDAELVTSLIANNKNISDLTGIEAFVNITELKLIDNQLTEIDISQNILLEKIWLVFNQLTSIDLSNNTKMQRISVGGNQLTALDLTMLPDVHTILAWQNELTSIDVSNNPLLTFMQIQDNLLENINLVNTPILDNINIGNNLLTNIDVNQSPKLTRLFVQNNQLSQLDISALDVIEVVIASGNIGLKLITTPITGSPTLTNLQLAEIGLSNFNPTLYPNLELLRLNNNVLSKFNTTSIANIKFLYLDDNEISSLDLSSNLFLEVLQTSNNQLTELNLQNGANTILTSVGVTTNSLTCITVDNDIDANNNVAPYNTWVTDVGVLYSLDCGGEPEVILIPDANFETALISQGYDSNGINGNILVTDAEAVLNLNISNNNIIDLTGIEGFVNLINLNVSNNLLSTIDLIENTNLEILDVSVNNLSELFVFSGRDLISLNCSDNQINTIDVSDHTNIETLDVSSNLIAELDIRDNTSLASFDATTNPNLFCIGVNDPNNIPAGWNKDNQATYSSNPDCIAPIIVAQQVTIYLDNKGDASVIASDFDNGSTDNVSANVNLIFSVDIEDFDCSNLGANTIELTVTDEAGNFDAQDVVVNVIDNIPPSVSTNQSFSYDLNGMAFNLDPLDIHKSSSDNCGVPTLSVDPSFFTSPGTYTVTLTAIDASGNTAEDTIDIEIEDTAASTELKFKKNLTLTIFPVPFTDVININFSKATDLNTVSVVLFNFNMISTGIQFSPNGGDLISNDTSGLITGTYILQITVGNETKTATILSGNN